MDEDFWRQKAALKWLDEGERNTRFFQGWVKQKRVKSRIHAVEEGKGILTEEVDIRNSAEKFFSELLTEDVGTLMEPDLDILATLPGQENMELLERVPTEEEVKQIVFELNAESAAGPDGYPAKFLSKLLTTRLAPLFPLLTVQHQSGFIKGRLLSDNVLLANELFHEIWKGVTSPNMVLKLVMEKAYDRAQRSTILSLVECLKHYMEVSGQKVNVGKSWFFLDKKHCDWAEEINEVSGFQQGSFPFKYLGVPIFRGKKKTSMFMFIRDKISARIHSWSHRHLSFGGRLTLIRSVMGAIPVHIVQILEPTKGAMRLIEQVMARFLWGSCSPLKKTHWINWERICLPTEEGGLGIRRLRDSIEAFSVKLWWRFGSRVLFGHDFWMGNHWNEEELWILVEEVGLPDEVIGKILQTPFDRREKDRGRWKSTGNGTFVPLQPGSW
ncbi:uncharacterized protein LOC121809004 [Salvia splendens]|uniref:uncharacterized protein LOC121809004 n=1 Tax=Salvia splendens TaxID=180675 RepID=UPI001C262ED3|nr:uncharacterized protein LOC121809004 [Salvia splendens]